MFFLCWSLNLVCDPYESRFYYSSLMVTKFYMLPVYASVLSFEYQLVTRFCLRPRCTCVLLYQFDGHCVIFVTGIRLCSVI